MPYYLEIRCDFKVSIPCIEHKHVHPNTTAKNMALIPQAASDLHVQMFNDGWKKCLGVWCCPRCVPHLVEKGLILTTSPSHRRRHV